jgi:hypothetical protein
MYYPKSQIKLNLYTNGGEFILSTTGEIYKGDYYKTSSEKLYTGKTPLDKPNILLLKLLDDPNEEFTGAGIRKDMPITFDFPYNQSPQNIRFIPIFNPTLPTQKDLNLGQFNRYFCKKTNELKYLEIDKETYDQLKAKDPKIAWDLYEPASILWIINGDQEDTFNANKFSVFKIEQNQRWYGFSQYFRENYLKYYESGYGGGTL